MLGNRICEECGGDFFHKGKCSKKCKECGEDITIICEAAYHNKTCSLRQECKECGAWGGLHWKYCTKYKWRIVSKKDDNVFKMVIDIGENTNTTLQKYIIAMSSKKVTMKDIIGKSNQKDNGSECQSRRVEYHKPYNKMQNKKVVQKRKRYFQFKSRA